jgi:hypothetical protein
MNFSLSVTFDLTDYDLAVQTYAIQNQYDVPDYTQLIDRTKTELEQLDGCTEVMFGRTSLIQFSLETDDFSVASTDIQASQPTVHALA